MKTLIQKTKYLLKYILWVLSGYIGRELSSVFPQKVTVLITYYSEVRMKNINYQIRNILKCTFVDRIIVSNHNPDIRINDKVDVENKNLILINQNVRRACGYRWNVAKTIDSEYLIAIDDDILLFPSQLKVLFEQLILKPDVPHGFSGMIHLKNGEFEYREREDTDVHYLCEVYAVTKYHIRQYFEMESLLEKQDQTLPDAVERLGDYIVISQTGIRNPKIHKTTRIFRSETFKLIGVSNHKERDFASVLERVSKSVEKIRYPLPIE